MMRRRDFLTATAATVAATGLGLATPAGAEPNLIRFRLPAPTGRLAIGVTRLHLVQRGRPDPWHPSADRELMVSIWYPARDDARFARAPYLDPLVAAAYTRDGVLGLPAGRIDWAAPKTTARLDAPARGNGCPVLLYAPGAGNNRALGTILVAELASRGYVVVTIDHTYETPIEFPGGRLVDAGIPSDPPDLEAAKRLFMDTREADTLFVLSQLDELAGGGNPDAQGHRIPHGLRRTLDLSRIGAFGHSAGGVTATRVMRADRRILAGANLDGFFEFGDNHPELGVDRPFLLMGAAAHPEQPPLFGKVRTHLSDPGWASFWAGSTGWKLDLAVPQGRHYTYTDAQWFLPQLAEPLGTDMSGLIGTVNAPRIVRAQRDYLAALFDQHLKNQPQPLLHGPVPWYPDVQFVR